ncbi:MAG: response regulator transcription factor [Anaerolineales bacterium]|nr:response regulator transcription factor [Anaerolineales bacterium]MCA9931947.1 response regulator transcription factor [Anaerolineales bacterium]
MVKRIRVLIVDDYAVVRHGLLALIDTAPDMVVVGEAVDGETAVRQTHRLQPDVVVMDMVMPGTDGIETIQAIKQTNAQTRILILTNFGEDQRVLAAVRAGVQGYLLKDAVLTDVVEAIREVYDGKLALHPSVTHVLLQAMQATTKPREKTAVLPPSLLTVREQDILKLVAKGLTNVQIAEFLLVEERTVRVHVSHILQKLNVENRTQAALYALRHGLATLND